MYLKCNIQDVRRICDSQTLESLSDEETGFRNRELYERKPKKSYTCNEEKNPLMECFFSEESSNETPSPPNKSFFSEESSKETPSPPKHTNQSLNHTKEQFEQNPSLKSKKRIYDILSPLNIKRKKRKIDLLSPKNSKRKKRYKTAAELGLFL